MTLNEGVAESTTAKFSEGTIDFDIKPLAYSDTGIVFRRHGTDDGEFVYLRADPDCPAADDCIQYAPITHGLMQWDLYPDEEGPAPIAPAGWNHLHLVISGDSMLVYVNRETSPSLVVPKLKGLSASGGIAFKGPAIYANLVLKTGEPTLPPTLADAPADHRADLKWMAAPPSLLAADKPVPDGKIPAPGVWRPIRAEASGLVNLSREFGTAHAPSASVGWLKTIVITSVPTRRTLRIGWARQLSVFLNGVRVFYGENPYYPEDRRLSPNGRLEADNAQIPLDLKAGRNEVVLAVGNRWRTHEGLAKASPYGWGAEAHFDDPTGLNFEE